MKNNEKLRVLGEIDEKYMDEANENIHFKTVKNAWIKGLSIAACALIVCGIISIPFLNSMTVNDVFDQKNETVEHYASSLSDSDMSWVWNAEDGGFDYVAHSSLVEKTTTDATMELEPESFIQQDSIYSEKYYLCPILTEKDYALYSYSFRKVNLKNIDRKTGETEITLGIGKNEESIICHAEVYTIRGIDPYYAIAVKADAASPYVQNSNVSGYMLYYRRDVSFESFAELIETYDLKNQMYIGPAFVQGLMTGTGIIEEIIYPNEENRIFCEKVLAVDGIICNNADIDKSVPSIGLECNFHVAGGEFGIQIFENGYLMTNIGGTLHTFDIGEETAKELFAFAQTIPDKFSGVDFYDGTGGEIDGEQMLPYDPAQTSGAYIPETTADQWENSYGSEETTGILPDDTAVERYPIETIPE